MAHIRRDKKSGNFFIRFRFGGLAFNRSLKTDIRRVASAVCGRVEETILLLERGRIEMPHDADPAEFILSDGKRLGQPVKSKVRTLSDLFRVYNAELPDGAKEETTLIGERRHQRHFKKHLRASSIVRSLSVVDIQRFVSIRSKDLCNGEPISPETIAEELATFRLIWNWAVDRDYPKGPSPTKGVRLPKSADKPPFMTRSEIEQKIERGGLSEKQTKRLWASLFLTREDIAEVLGHVRRNAARSFICPMFVFAAHTGARRSEILRSRIDDFNLDTGVVGIREKKKRKNRKITFRHVDLTPLLTMTMRDWFDSHPGGQFTICDDPAEIPDGMEDDEVGMSPYKAQNHFDRVLVGSQ